MHYAVELHSAQRVDIIAIVDICYNLTSAKDAEEDLSTHMIELQMREPASQSMFIPSNTPPVKIRKKETKPRRHAKEVQRFTLTDPEDARVCRNPACNAPFTPPNNRVRAKVLYCCSKCRMDHFMWLYPRVPREEYELLERIKKGELKVVIARDAKSTEGAL